MTVDDNDNNNGTTTTTRTMTTTTSSTLLDGTKDNKSSEFSTTPDEAAAAAASPPAMEVVVGNADDSSEDDEQMPITSFDGGHGGHNHHASDNNGCGRGIVKDLKRTVGTHWWTGMTNFDQKTIAVSFFLFFACISPAITFGAIYAKATSNWIGAVEMITATAWVGIAYALIGGQPMMINGGTGPVLAFSEILYKMSESMNVPFLTFNAWIGLWVAAYMIIASIVDLNRIIVYATRFTDEIFALLIAAIFIINALGSPFSPVGIYYYFESSHKSHDEYKDDEEYSHTATALLSLLLCLGTVQLAFILRKIKFSSFMPNQTIRNVVTDFAVVLSILIMTLVAGVLFDDVQLETLNVPDKFAPTYACCTSDCTSNWPDDCPDIMEPVKQRDWIVNLFDLNGKGYIPLLAAIPATLAFVLVFLDDGITWHLINHPSHKLQHGDAYNYDTLLIGITIAVNSMLGLPWLVAATVRSLNHIHAMAEKSSDGKITSVKETRLTHLFIHLLCLVSIFALELLKLIPMPVLYGVFLFMGLVSLGTNQFYGRLLMYMMERGKYPIEPYTVHVRPSRMHIYTGIQLLLFLTLYIVKSIKTIAIAFPLIIACCIPVRLYLLPKIFTLHELIMLDSDDDVIKTYLLQQQQSRNNAGGGNKNNNKNEDGNEDDDNNNNNNRSIDDSQKDNTPKDDSITKKLDDDNSGGTDEDDDVEKQKKQQQQIQRQQRSTTARSSRPRRMKSVSCPNPNMMFSEVSFAATDLKFVHHHVIHEEDEEEDDITHDHDDNVRRHHHNDHGHHASYHDDSCLGLTSTTTNPSQNKNTTVFNKSSDGIMVSGGDNKNNELRQRHNAAGTDNNNNTGSTNTITADDVHTSTSTTTDTTSGGTTTRRRYKKTSKTVSCPPHMLFKAAERQVSSNYFFG